MLGKVKQVLSGRLIKNVIVVASGSAGAQLITMIFMPAITRMYGPEAFGLLGTFMAIVSILMPISAFTYPIAIILPKSNSDAVGVTKLSMMVACSTSAITAVILLFYGTELAVLFDAETIALYLMFIPVAMLFSALHQVSEQWAMRLHLYKVSAMATLLQSLIINISKVGLGVLNPVAQVLIILQVISSALCGLLMWGGMRGTLALALKNTKQRSTLKELALEYKDFAFYRTPQVAINAFSQGLPILMLALYFGPVSAGFYALGRTVVSIPSALLGKAVGDVFYPRISAAANREEDVYPLVKKATLLLALAGILPFSLIILAGPWLFSVVFGNEWLIAGEYARWLSVWMFFMFINAPAVKATPVIGAQKIHLLFTIFGISLRLLALFIGYYFFSSDIVAVASFSVVSCILNLILILGVLGLCDNFDRKIKGRTNE